MKRETLMKISQIFLKDNMNNFMQINLKTNNMENFPPKQNQAKLTK